MSPEVHQHYLQLILETEDVPLPSANHTLSSRTRPIVYQTIRMLAITEEDKAARILSQREAEAREIAQLVAKIQEMEEAEPAEPAEPITEVPKHAGQEHSTSDAVLGQAKDSRGDSESTLGHCVVLHMCLKLLHEPEKLEEWFFDISSVFREYLRRTILQQWKDVDQWLCDKYDDVESRSILLCSTTIVSLKAEQMSKGEHLTASGPERSMCHTKQPEPGERSHWQSANREGPKQDFASGLHFKTLQVLRKLLENSDKSHSGARELAYMVRRDSLSSSERLWDRLSAVVVYHSKKESNWPLWDRFQKERDNDKARDIDDVIIYCCLMMILLFRTAADSSKILASGLWDKVVPII